MKSIGCEVLDRNDVIARVQKGGLIWCFDARIDQVYSEPEIATLPEHMQRFLRTYSTWHEADGLATAQTG
jgi:hypothetical protein